ncbi:MAG: hypothetical protein Q9227_008435 [Pyrenula ochraceoflavens]
MATESAILAGVALTKPTAPVTAKFHKIGASMPVLARTGHTLNVVKDKAYIYGGDRGDGSKDKGSEVHVVTLPTSLDLANLESTIDYQCITPVNPIKPLPQQPATLIGTSDPNPEAIVSGGQLPSYSPPPPRSAHASTSISSSIFVFGGRPPSTKSESDPVALDESGAVHRFSTITTLWATIQPHETKCSSGVPPPRTHASMASTPHPLPSRSGEDQTLSPITSTEEAHDETAGGGTLFLHGGLDRNGQQLRDVWAFDIASRIWSKWPDVPEPPSASISTPQEDQPVENSDAGNTEPRSQPSPKPFLSPPHLVEIESRLWRTGDPYGRVHYFDLVRDQFSDMGGQGELGVTPKTGQWESASFGSAQEGHEDALKRVEEKMGPTAPHEQEWPPEREGGALVPVSTGQGREYLALILGQPPKDEGTDTGEDPGVWTFQLRSDKITGAALKDRVKGWFGMDTGESKWAKSNIVEASKESGVESPPKGLTQFGCDAGGDWGSGGEAVIWGGKDSDGTVRGEGWVVEFV